MRRSCLMIFALVALATFGAAQGFECQPVGAFPTVCCSDCELVQSNAALLGTSPATGVDSTPACGFPAAGAQYARIQANGPLNVALGGPVARPLALNVAELRIPVPPGAVGVSFSFEFFNADSFNSATFNDGFAASIVGNANALLDLSIVDLAYVDSSTAAAPGVACVDPVSGGVDTGSTGAQIVSHLFSATELADIAAAGGAYLSLACWNGGDNTFDSHAAVDCVSWGALFPIPGTGVAGGSIVADLTVNPADSFAVGAANPTVIQFRGISQNVFIEGYHCMVGQYYGNAFNFYTVPGIAGIALVDPTSPFTILSDNKLTGGLNNLTAARGAIVSFSFSDPALCGTGVLIQAYVEDEHLGSPIATARAFSFAYLGFIH